VALQKPILFHNSIRKYTLALLETFGNLKIQKSGTTDNPVYKKIPIKYTYREKMRQFDEVQEQQLLSGNYNILPRSSLTLTSIIKNQERQSNKFNKIATNEFGNFLFNAVSFDFAYDIAILCRGMNEASSIIEQITSRFNPTYTLKINEIPNQITPTSVPIQLVEIDVQGEEYEEISTNIVTVSVSLILKGNFYSPIENMENVKDFKMYLNLWDAGVKNEYSRAVLFDYDVVDSEVQNMHEYTLTNTPKIAPEITDIISDDSVVAGEPLNLEVKFLDPDNKMEELTFIWDVTGSGVISDIKDNKAILTDPNTEIITVKVIITDIHNNSSNLFSKDITVT